MAGNGTGRRMGRFLAVLSCCLSVFFMKFYHVEFLKTSSAEISAGDASSDMKFEVGASDSRIDDRQLQEFDSQCSEDQRFPGILDKENVEDLEDLQDYYNEREKSSYKSSNQWEQLSSDAEWKKNPYGGLPCGGLAPGDKLGLPTISDDDCQNDSFLRDPGPDDVFHDSAPRGQINGGKRNLTIEREYKEDHPTIIAGDQNIFGGRLGFGNDFEGARMQGREYDGTLYDVPKWAPRTPGDAIPIDLVRGIEDTVARHSNLLEAGKSGYKKIPPRRKYLLKYLPNEFMHPKENGPYRGPWLPLEYYQGDTYRPNVTHITEGGWPALFKWRPELFFLRMWNEYRRPYLRFGVPLSIARAFEKLPPNMRPGAAGERLREQDRQERKKRWKPFMGEPREEVVLHLIGAGIKERDAFESGGFTLLQTFYPDVWRWRVEFIGPDADLCGDLPESPGKFRATLFDCPWHEYVQCGLGKYPRKPPEESTDWFPDHLEAPPRWGKHKTVRTSYIIGCWTGMGVIADSWIESIPSLLESDIPFLLLSNCDYEVEGEKRLLQAFGAEHLTHRFFDPFNRADELYEAANPPGDEHRMLNYTMFAESLKDVIFDEAKTDSGDVDASTSSEGRGRPGPGETVYDFRCDWTGEVQAKLVNEPYPLREPDIEEMRLQRESRRMASKYPNGKTLGTIPSDEKVLERLREKYDERMVSLAFNYIKKGGEEPTPSPTPAPGVHWFEEKVKYERASSVWPGAKEIELEAGPLEKVRRGKFRRRIRKLLKNSRRSQKAIEEGEPLRVGWKYDKDEECNDIKLNCTKRKLLRWNETFKVQHAPGGYGWWVKGSNYTKEEMETLARVALKEIYPAYSVKKLSNLKRVLSAIEEHKLNVSERLKYLLDSQLRQPGLDLTRQQRYTRRRTRHLHMSPPGARWKHNQQQNLGIAVSEA